MADYDILNYNEDFFQPKHDSITDLHAYYMSQFNLELENCNKPKQNLKLDSFKYGNEVSFDFEVLDWSNTANNTNTTHLDAIDQVVETNINEDNIKEVLLDLDNIEFDEKSYKTDSTPKIIDSPTEVNFYETNNDYIDDECLIDELCREEGEGECRLSPEFNEDLLPTNEKTSLPSIETAFSKKYCNYTNVETQPEAYNYNNVTQVSDNTQFINSLEQYSYPNNILYNMDSSKNYVLPDTPTSVTEFTFDRNERKVSVSESIESDVQSTYYDDNSETFEDDDLFVNLEDFGLHYEREPEYEEFRPKQNERKVDKEKSQGERYCLWENCNERYPDQNTLVEHIERAHVNTYKGDEFSCLWRECTRARRPFNARYKLLIHMRVHSGHKPNRCHHPGCGKAFSRLENLKIHVRSHTGERPYACLAPHCRKAFSNSSDRAKHQRTHFNARPYACGAAGCGKRYTDPSSLRKHIKTHPHIANVPRTCTPSRPIKRAGQEQLVPRSPAKLATLMCIRDKLTVPKLNRYA